MHSGKGEGLTCACMLQAPSCVNLAPKQKSLEGGFVIGGYQLRRRFDNHFVSWLHHVGQNILRQLPFSTAHVITTTELI